MTASLTRESVQAAIDAATRELTPHERVAVAERVARETARRRRRSRYPSPGVLSHRIDPLTTRETPALQLIDRELVACTEAMERGESVRLAVFMPPQEGKSRRVTISFPLWLLLRNPDLRIAIASFESEIAAGFSKPIRDWITEHGSGTPLNPRSLADDLLGITLRGDSSSRSRFDIAGHTGSVVAVGMRGGLTSKAVDVLIVDDPYKNREQADNPKHRRMVEEWFRNVALPRLPTAALVVLVQTRWHPEDLGGYIVRSELALPAHLRRWRFVNVPAQAERPPRGGEGASGWLPDSLGREPGQFLVSARGRTAEDWAARRAEVGEMTWGSLYQQRPTPPEGAVFAYEHITKHRRPAEFDTASSRRAVAVDTSAGGADEAGLVAGYRGTDGRVYVTADRSGRMSSAAWARGAWLLALDTDADDLVWEQNLAGPTMRQELVNAWQRIVAQARTLLQLQAEEADAALIAGRVRALTRPDAEPATAEPATRDELLDRAHLRWASEEQKLPIGEAVLAHDDRAELAEVLDRLESGRLSGGVLETPPCRLVAVHASVGKRARATPVAVAYETGKVSHVGVLAELEQEQTQWQEGAASPGRLDALVWLVTHLLGARRGRTSTAAAVTLPTGPTTHR